MSQKLTEATQCRVNYLREVSTLDKLLDEFQDMGMPMGSDRWAEYCLERLRELRAKEKTLRTVEGHLQLARDASETCFSKAYVERRRRMTAEFQQRSAAAGQPKEERRD